MKKPKSKMDEKAVEVIACAVTVGVMILLLSGDMIISHFIKINPNDNVSIKKEKNEEKNRQEFLTMISFDEAITKILEEENVYFFFGREKSKDCQTFLAVLKEFPFQDHLYYIDQDSIRFEDESYNQFVSYSDDIRLGIGSTPFFVSFQNHTYHASILGMREDLKSSIEKMVES